MRMDHDDEKDSRFKTWIVPLPDFQLNHEPSRGEEDHRNFIGRDELTQSFVNVLNKSNNHSGSYLVTGYRGVGKTSFVRHVLARYSKGKQSIPRVDKDSLIRVLISKAIRKLSYLIAKNLNNLFPLSDKTPKLYIKAYPNLCLRNWLTVKYHQSIYQRQSLKEDNKGNFIFNFALNLINKSPASDSEEREESQREFGFAPHFRKVTQRFVPLIKSSLVYVIIIASLLFIYPFDNFSGTMKLIVSIGLILLLPYLYKHFFKTIHRPIFTLNRIYQRIFHPVIEVHINLGYEISSPKDVLFGIISLLHNKYSENTSLRSASGLYIASITILITTALTFFIQSHAPGLQTEARLMAEILRPASYLTDSSTDSFKNEYSARKDKEVSKYLDQFIYNKKNEDKNYNAYLQKQQQKHLEKRKAAEAHEKFENSADVIAKTISSCNHYRLSPKSFFSNRDFEHPFFRQMYCSATNFIVAFIGKPDTNSENNTSTENKFFPSKENFLTPFRLFYFFSLWGLIFLFIRISIRFLGPGAVARRLELLHLRTIATETTETLAPRNVNIFYGRRRRYNPLDIRQAENLLLDCLERNRKIHWLMPRLDIIFVFDELDKIRPLSGTKDENNNSKQQPFELGLSEMVRARKLEVETLLGSLKNLITVAPCRFIFIAGREMMDANLADRGETRHLYGSLFDEVLYIPSFLTDDSDDNHSDISSMIEQYVCRRLLRKNFAISLHYLRESEKKFIDEKVIRNMILDSYDCWTLRNYDRYLKEIGYDPADRVDLISLLQDFIFFLTYRSAGNPKKLAVLFEEFVKPEPYDLFIGEDKYKRRTNNYYQPPPITPDIQGVLRFDYADQYRIKLISNTFIMLHGEQSRLIQAYGDKLSVAVFTILDYIFKFHSSGFCFRDLERMPDVLDIHRAPALPSIIDMILKRLLQPYLRRMNNGIYDFRFLRHFQSEVIYLSQFSEDDLAAFNFSLDESIQIKEHYKKMLDSEMKMHEQAFRGIAKKRASGTPHVLPYLHTILGDLHFLDKEFDQARTAYRNAVQYLEPSIQSLENEAREENKNGEKKENKNPLLKDSHQLQEDINQILLYVRLLLKIGLLEEQRGVFDSAIAVYYQASRVVDHVLEGDYSHYFIHPHIEQLNVLLQPYICLAFLHAKRDPLETTAELIMDRKLEKIAGLLVLNNSNESNNHLTREYLYQKEQPKFQQHTAGRRYPGPITLEISSQRVILAKFEIRQAEMRLMRSKFTNSMHSYTNALCLLWNEKDAYYSHSYLENLGMAFIGLGDATSGYTLNKCYSEPATKKYQLKLPDEKFSKLLNSYLTGDEKKEEVLDLIEESVKFLRNMSPHRKGDIEKEDIAENAVNYYVIAALIFLISGNAADARLALWKLSYVLAFGLSYLDDEIFKKQRKCPKQAEKMEWLFGSVDSTTEDAINNPLQKLSMRAFGYSYQAHTKRLRRLFKNNRGRKEKNKNYNDDLNLNHRLCWSAAPLSQSATVMGRFWIAYWQDPENKKGLTEENFSIRDMGPFPVNARILAYYFKARWYLKLSKNSSIETEDKRKALIRGLRMLIHCVEAISFFEGGEDSLNPPLGLVYYHVWITLKKLPKEDIEELEKQSFFRKELRQYLQQEFCQTRAIVMLNRMINRHSSGDAFFQYVHKKYYLYDEFSDNYTNVSWAVEYGLIPVAKRMLARLQE